MTTLRKLIAAACASGALLAAPFTLQAVPGNTSELNQQDKTTETLSGTISDVASDELTLKGMDGSETTIRIDDETAISLDGKKASASELAAGQYAVLSVQSKGGDHYALIVSARTS